jgi:hypothetical protein
MDVNRSQLGLSYGAVGHEAASLKVRIGARNRAYNIIIDRNS